MILRAGVTACWEVLEKDPLYAPLLSRLDA
jgi:hypothetical protein